MAVEEFQPTRKRFLKLTLRTKWITPSERALKTVPKNGVRNCVHFCLRSLGALERCEKPKPYVLGQLQWCLKLTLRTKWITPSERALKTVPEMGV